MLPKKQEVVLTQWKQMKQLIVSDASLSRMKFNELWPIMLDGYAQHCVTAVQFHPACGWHRSHILSRHEWLRTLDFPHERPQDEGENGTRDPARFGLVVQVPTSISSSLMSGKQC
jgi:hypothetical protein